MGQVMGDRAGAPVPGVGQQPHGLPQIKLRVSVVSIDRLRAAATIELCYVEAATGQPLMEPSQVELKSGEQAFLSVEVK